MRKSDGPQSGGIEADETNVGGKSQRGHPVANHERHQIELEARGLDPGQHLRGNRHPCKDEAVVFGMTAGQGSQLAAR